MLLGAPKAPEWLRDGWSRADARYVYALHQTLHTKDDLWRMQLRTVRRTAPAPA